MLPFCELFFKYARTFVSIIKRKKLSTERFQKVFLELTIRVLENLFGQLRNCVSIHNSLTVNPHSVYHGGIRIQPRGGGSVVIAQGGINNSP
jgi:hypothetical protein